MTTRIAIPEYDQAIEKLDKHRERLNRDWTSL